ncbi:hypothetical protein [Halalkalibacter okhensis]|uniref:Uncharacterized protein n=1 Tax=Halalkalibacter okhensis TaxID=333138 RepID=A0A0B0IHL5_9BACI|nr:hypothetical protein [Halalkalibacter okhensis]KHF39161.1 hypothetical protein LQ50_17215 [Halalkalibacter okhensis]
MKTQFDEQLKKLDSDIRWNQQRNLKVRRDIEAEIGKMQTKNPFIKNLLVYSSTIVAFALFAVMIGLSLTSINDSQSPSSEVPIVDSEEEGPLDDEQNWVETEDESDPEDDVKMTENRNSWTDEEMENDISAGIILTHRQLTKFVEGEWVPDYNTLEGQQEFSQLHSYISQASTAAFHLSADNYLYVDLMNLNSVLGEAFQNKDDEGVLLAYQVVHDLDVAYNGFEPDQGPFGVTLYRDATYDVVRSYLGRE